MSTAAAAAAAATPGSHRPRGFDKPGLRAYSDPVIFRDDRVLKTLLRKETRYVPGSPDDYLAHVQTEVEVHMRKEVADWMLEVCEDQQSQPEVFCLAMNYFDRFLSVCAIARSQLQLLGAVCLLVAWKVREHEPLPAMRLVEYSDYNLTLLDIMEWEVLLLSKLDWDMSSVIASDFVEHILQRVRRLRLSPAFNIDVVRQNAETLLTMCSAHAAFSALSPSLVAAAAVLTTLRPILEAPSSAAAVSAAAARRGETPSPSSTSSGASVSPTGSTMRTMSKAPDMEDVLDAVEKFALIDKTCVRTVMDRIEEMMRASLPPSPAPSPTPRTPGEDEVDDETTSKSFCGRKGLRSGRRHSIPESLSSPPSRPGEDMETKTPTKVLDVARGCH